MRQTNIIQIMIQIIVPIPIKTEITTTKKNNDCLFINFCCNNNNFSCNRFTIPKTIDYSFSADGKKIQNKV